MPEVAPRFKAVDMTRHRKRAAVQNVSNVFNMASPATRQSGLDWYEKVHEATAKGIKGSQLDIHQGAAIVAAVSPAMDWEKRNIDALGELRHLNRSQWGNIAKGDRSPLTGMSIDQSSTSNLLKARRIMESNEDPYEILNRRTAPKTNSFAHNIAEPDKTDFVTVDGRAHDIAVNRMQGWQQNRGIGSAALKTGGKTRYEHFEDAYKSAAKSLSIQHNQLVLPHQTQAVTWEQGKVIERSGLTKKGQPRQQGAMRVGQRYA